MAPPTRQALEVAKQFRRALALDLIDEAVPRAYELLKETVRLNVQRVRNNEQPSRQGLDAAKALISMAGMSERVVEPSNDVNLSKMSLAELERMISDLKVIEGDAKRVDSAADAAQAIDDLM